MAQSYLKIAVLTHLPLTEQDKKDVVHAVAMKLKELEFADVPSNNTIQRVYVEGID